MCACVRACVCVCVCVSVCVLICIPCVELTLARRHAEIFKLYIIFRNIIGELPFKGVKGLPELYSKLKEGVRLERPAHCSEEL